MRISKGLATVMAFNAILKKTFIFYNYSVRSFLDFCSKSGSPTEHALKSFWPTYLILLLRNLDWVNSIQNMTGSKLPWLYLFLTHSVLLRMITAALGSGGQWNTHPPPCTPRLGNSLCMVFPFGHLRSWHILLFYPVLRLPLPLSFHCLEGGIWEDACSAVDERFSHCHDSESLECKEVRCLPVGTYQLFSWEPAP